MKIVYKRMGECRMKRYHALLLFFALIIISALIFYCQYKFETPNSGYPEYDQLILSVKKSRKSGELPSGVSTDLIRENPGWVLKDIDNNGQVELIFGRNSNKENYVYNIYTLLNDEVVQVAEGWNRNIYMLCADGTIANYWSGSSSEYGSNYYQYKDCELQLVESLAFLDWSTPNHEYTQWYYSDQFSSQSLLIPNQSGTYFDLNPQFTPISHEAAEAIMENRTCDLLDFTPFFHF